MSHTTIGSILLLRITRHLPASLLPFRPWPILSLLIAGASTLLIRTATVQVYSLEPQESEQKRSQSVPGEILVRFKTNASPLKSTALGTERTEISVFADGKALRVQLERLSTGPEIVGGLRFARVAPDE